MKDMIIVIGGVPVLASLNKEYDWKHREWESQCASVRARFHKKTSRSEKNGKIYEYTNWYEESGSGLKSVGKEEPEYNKYYPPEPKPVISFKALGIDGNLILQQKDFEANLNLFKECLVFRLEDCKNYLHPLYKNPEKALKDSVRRPGVSSARSLADAGQKKDDLCLNDGDCDSCEHQDDCPVIAEDLDRLEE